MVAERERVRGLVSTPAHPKVSPSRSTAEGARRDAHKKERLFRVRWLSDLSKSTGNVGQQAKDSIRFSCRQAWEMTIVLK
ncbi:hypothetical protein E2537_11190 [Acinetobacter baumannii]|nr:hypothetical protein E2537_11190 [Acinetobacter baumannii]TEX26963.1 hypothetical protein E2532_10495 [Acinetobacter baumannii]